MDRRGEILQKSVIGLIIVAGCMYIAGCSGPQRIVAPDAKELSVSKVREGEREGVTLRAVVLDEEQGKRLLGVDATKQSVVPVLFAINNQTENPYQIHRGHFILRIGQLCIEPALPGRAATLLCNTSQSQGAAWAGYLVFGILAAPSIDTAEKKEVASVEAHRELIFSEARVTPNGAITGYLFFESPLPPKKIKQIDLEFRISGDKEKLIAVQLFNPYAPPKGE